MKQYFLLIWLLISISIGPLQVADAKAAAQKPSDVKKLPQFNAVDLGGVGDLYIRQSDEEGLTVSAEDSILPLIKVSVSNKVLYLNLLNAGNHTQAKIKYYLFVKELKKITANTASTVFIPDALKTDSLELLLSGLGEADIKMAVKLLRARIDGGSKLVASGTADEQQIVINGAGEFNGVKLSGHSANVKVSGSALAKTHALEILTVKASEDSIVKYCGHPTLTKQVSEHGFVAPGSTTDCQ